MPKVTLEITSEQHDQLKAMAEFHRLSVEEYILESTLQPQQERLTPDEEEAMQELAKFLRPRIEEAERKEYSNKTIQQIKEEAQVKYASNQ